MKSVKGMLPHNTLGRAQGMKLKVFVGAEHTHAAQQPEVLDISGLYLRKGTIKVCHKHNMRVLDVVKTLLHAFALFQELVKSLLTKDVEEYIPHADLRLVINQPFAVTSTAGSYDVFVNVVGGGYAGQAGAIPSRYRSCPSSSRPRLPRFIETRRTSYVTHVKLSVRNQVLRKLVKHHNLVNVNSKNYYT